MAKSLYLKFRQCIQCLIYGDKFYLHNDVKMSDKLSHSNWQDKLVEYANKRNWKVLEIGSREVTGKSKLRDRFCNYKGFDFYGGDNVDVVGDVHKLSEYFNGEKFDLIFTSACFEHFAMPWIAAEEIIKCLKVGGYVFVETHYSYSSHERPWHYFQFSEQALAILFNKQFGVKSIECGVSNPIVARFSKYADKYLRGFKITGMYCHSEFFGRKFKEVDSFDWHNVDLQKLYSNTKYVSPDAKKKGILAAIKRFFIKEI